MEWLRSHPYLDALISAGALLIVGALVVHTQLAAAPGPGRDTSWGTDGGIYVDAVTTGHTSLPETEQRPAFQTTDLGYIPLANQNEIGSGPADESTSFDFQAFVAALSSSKPANLPTETDTGADAYSFIPSGLIATTTLLAKRTPLQEKLYSYGNEVGDTIVSFEHGHPDQPTILKNHIEQQDSPEAIAALKKLGGDLAHVGDTLASMELVPTQAAAANTALAEAYRTIGKKLAAVPDAKGNDTLYDAIVSYNAAAEDFAKKYVALALIFQSYGVTFSPGDGGSIFVFPSSGL